MTAADAGRAEHADHDGYDGPAELISDDGTIPVTVTLRGQFDPISGKYSWYGRVSASPEVASWCAAGSRPVRLRTPHAEVDTALTDVDPWGRPRVQGFGRAPFEVLDAVPPDSSQGVQ